MFHYSVVVKYPASSGVRSHHPLVAALIGISMMVVGLICAVSVSSMLFVLSLMGGSAQLPVDCALVFGSAVHLGQYAGPGIERRVAAAVDLYTVGSVDTLILSGGTGSGNALSEAEVMRRVAIKRGVAGEDIWLERHATNTWENIALSAPLRASCDTVVGISDGYHLSRIRMLAWLQGAEMTVHPADRPPNLIFELRSIAREAVANLYYGGLAVIGGLPSAG